MRDSSIIAGNISEKQAEKIRAGCSVSLLVEAEESRPHE